MSENATSAANQQGSLAVLNWPAPSETTRRIPSMNLALARLLALLYTDGCLSPKKPNSWRIYFQNKSAVLVDLLRSCLIELFELPFSRFRIRKRDPYLAAVVDSKEIGQFLVQNFGTFRTLRYADGSLTDARLPVRALIANGFVDEFLRVAFTCDGGISFYPAYRNGSRGGTKWLIRTIFLACSHPNLRLDYLELLFHLGIEVRHVPSDCKIKIETEKGIKKFYELVGFTPGVDVTDHSKYWRGYTKQEVLYIMVNSYISPREIYNHPRFKKGNDIVRPS